MIFKIAEIPEIKIRNQKNYHGPGEYIGRPSFLGNPFQIGKDGTRTEVIEKYKTYFYSRLSSDVQFQDYMIRLAAELKKINSLNLICWCNPLPCHGDIIKQLLLELTDE